MAAFVLVEITNRDRYGSLKSPTLSCISITLLASSVNADDGIGCAIVEPCEAPTTVSLQATGPRRLRRGKHGERLAEPLLQFSIAPHQFEKANRIAQWTNFAHLIGVNSRDWDRLDPVAFTAGDDEYFGVVIESVSTAKQSWN